jgi:hypothetical protein
VQISKQNCKIQTFRGIEFKILVPSDTGNAQIQQVVNRLGNHFDLVISTPAECQAGYESDQSANCKGVEITAVRKNSVGSNEPKEFTDIREVMDLVWPEDKKQNRPILTGMSDDIEIRERHCEKPEN